MYEKEVAERDAVAGVVTGLAYSGSGNGGILFVESTKMPGKGSLSLTGMRWRVLSGVHQYH